MSVRLSSMKKNRNGYTAEMYALFYIAAATANNKGI